MSKNILRSIVAMCLLGTVAAFAAAPRDTIVTIDTQTTNGIFLTIQAAGPNGRIVGKGRLRIQKAITWPVTITSGSISFTTSTSSSSGSGSGGSTTTVTGSSTTTLVGYVKPRTGPNAVFSLVATGSGLATMTITGGSTLITNGKVKIEI